MKIGGVLELRQSCACFLAREGRGAVHEVGGLVKLLQSFTKRLLQSDDFLAREGGREGGS